MWRGKTIGRLVDATAWITVWVGVGLAIAGVLPSGFPELIYFLLFAPIALPLLVGLRLSRRLAELADVGRRESLAVTLLSPGEYLAPRLVWFGVGAHALFVPAFFVLFVLAMDDHGSTFEFDGLVEYGGPLGGSLLLACALSVLVSGLAFRRLCRRRRTDFFSELIPALFGLAGALGEAAFSSGFLWAVDRSFISETLFCALTGAFAVALSTAAYAAGLLVWRQAAREYYQFEPFPKEAKPRDVEEQVLSGAQE